ncbi:MAG: M3 family metallopeptidase [Bacteroidales bacterium]|nr:M3 family metallopeptidase [Bacteroidales bacterium]
MTASGCNKINPFLGEWKTPYGLPPFDQIRERDYVPATKIGIKLQEKEIDAIIACSEEPTFENTVAAYQRSGAVLDKVQGVLFNLSETDGTPSLQRIVDKIIPMLTEHNDNIFMNPYFFDRVKSLYDKKEALGLDREQEMVLEQMYRAFVNNGIALDKEGQAKMRAINKDIAVLTQRFGNNILAQNNAFADEFGVAVSEYAGKMASCSDRDLREKMFRAYSSRGNNGGKYDNKEIALQIAGLRLEKAKLLGYDNSANQVLSDKMAHDAAAVDRFLSELMIPAVAKAREEIADMQKLMDEDVAAGLLPAGPDAVIRPWDWAYYADRVRQMKYALNEDETRPYFKMENVREGVFATAHRLYGLNIEKLDSIPVYHPDVEGFKVTDADGSLIGILLTDYYPRSTKRGGAWMNNFRNQEVTADGEDIRPIIVNVGNFSKPSGDVPSLLTLDEVSTMFHEFGHALHGLLSQCRYKAVSGTSVARDFVELPSQINENWAFQPEVLAGYARHYLTGEVIPAELVEKIRNAGTFNQGFMTTELVAASILDMKWHELTSLEVPADCQYASDVKGSADGMYMIDPIKFEEYVCQEMGLIDEIIPRYRTTYFNHIFNGGYNAGYYSYLWAEVLDKDAFELFVQNGIFDKATALSFRHNILEKGGSEEPMVLYRRFRGAEPDPAALLRARGLE